MTPFANFITAYNGGPTTQKGNEYHLQFTQRNGNWLAAELGNPTQQPYTASCAYLCSSQISGNSVLCTSEVYSFASGATNYSWSISNTNGGVTLSGNGTPNVTITRTNTYNGSLTLNLNVGDNNSLCGIGSFTKTIWGGTPRFHIEPDPNNTNYVTFYAVSDDPSVTLEQQGLTPANVVWKRLDTGATSTGFSYFKAGPNYNWSFDVSITASNNCGTYVTYATIAPPAPPACLSYNIVKSGKSTHAYIIIDPCGGSLVSNSKPDKMSNLTTQVVDSRGQMVINTQDLEFNLDGKLPGTYYVRVMKNGKMVHSQTLLKN